MNKSINQIRVELSKIVTGDNPVANVKTGHLQLYSFFWGDFLRAYKENTLNYPVMGAFYPNGSLLRNQTQVQLTIYIADKLYKDWSNLNDIESDTLQICRDVFNVMNHSTRWNKIGRVQSCSVSKFIQKGGDEVAGHEMTIQFLIRDSSSICGLPMVDYDFDQVVGDGCSPVQIYENGVLVDTVASGGIYEYTHGDAHYVITNSVGGILYSGDIAENDTLTQAIANSVATLKDTAGVTISTTNILAQGTANIEAPDGSVTVNGAAYDTVVSGGALNVPVVNTVANPVGTIIVGGVLVANSPITVNSISEGSLISEETLDIQLTDGTSPVTPTDVTQVANVMTIQVPGVGIDPDAQAFLDITGIIDATISSAIITLVSDLKTAGIWSKMVAIYPYVGGTAVTHKYNLKMPMDINPSYRLVFSGGITHDANGVTFGGVNGSANSKALRAADVNYGFGCYIGTDTNITATDAYIDGAVHIFPSLGGLTTYHRGIGAAPDNYPDIDSRGFYHQYGKPSGSSAFKNGIKTLTGAVGSTSPGELIFGSGSGFSNRRHQFGFLGTSLTDVEAADYYTIVQAFQTTLGRQV